MKLEIAFTTIPHMIGHMMPLLPYIDELLRRGHSITLFHGSDPKFKNMIEQYGLSACQSVTYEENLYDCMKGHYTKENLPSVIVHDFFAYDAADAAEFLDVAVITIFPNMAVTINPWAPTHNNKITPLLWTIWCGMIIPTMEAVLARILWLGRNYTRRKRNLPFLIEQDIYPTPYQPKTLVSGKPRMMIGCTSPELEFNSASRLDDDIFTMVGPALPSVIKPISTDLQEWIQKRSKDRIIVYLAFGSMYKYTKEKVQSIQKELLQYKNKISVLWSLPKKEQSHLQNYDFIRIESFFPQTALFQTGNIDIFITHCGSNSVYEAILSGIPMICCPGKADQPGNAMRLVRKGVAVIARDGIGFGLDYVLDNLEVMKSKSRNLCQLLQVDGGAKKAASVIEEFAVRSSSPSSPHRYSRRRIPWWPFALVGVSVSIAAPLFLKQK